MKKKLDSIRKVGKKHSFGFKIVVSVALLLLGVGIGVFQKYGRFAIWIFLGTVISIYSESPFRAGLNTFLFFIGMVSAYYIYCKFVLGFLPASYMLIWICVSFASAVLAFVCWYARGEGIVALTISGIILGVLFSQAFLFIRGFGLTHIPEVVIFILALVVLRRKPKQFILEIGISILTAVVYQIFIPYWG